MIKEKYLGKDQWEYRYTVEGRWPFPTDMLRYDNATPATAADKAMIDELSVDNLKARFYPVRIDLIGSIAPTKSRWKSFSWKVVDIE